MLSAFSALRVKSPWNFDSMRVGIVPHNDNP